MVCKPAAESSSGGRVIHWIDAQLSPALVRWRSKTFGVTAHAVRDLGLRDAKDLPIFHAAREAGAVLLSVA
jgi:predicted nuclease of predicted toxin-antitoxin system